MKFITLHLSQSRARIALRSRTLLRSPSARSLLLASAPRVARLDDVHRPAVVAGEIKIASSEDSTTIRGGLSHRYEACIWPTKDEDRETIKEEWKEDFAREEDERRDARLSAGQEGKRRRLRKGEVGGGYKVTRVQNRARERERANERVRAVRPA